MQKKITLSDLWISSKHTIIVLSILLSLIAVIIPFVITNTVENLVMLSFGVLTYLLSLLVGLAYETQILVQKESRKQVTKIQLNDDFWNSGKKFKTFYVNALNGERFFDMIIEKNITVEKIHLIVPNIDAIRAYYKTDKIVMDTEKAVHHLQDSIENITTVLRKLKNGGKIRSFEIRHLNTFPLDFYAIFDGKYCLVGKYIKDATRGHTMGLKSISWIERDYQLVSHYTNHFEDIWENL